MNSNLPNSSSPNPIKPPAQENSSTLKEHGGFSSSIQMESVSLPEEHIPKEVVSSGVVHKELVDVPPDVAQLGVQVAGGQQSVNQQASVSITITLPISDDQVISGLHENFKTSIRWLALWCLRQLKRAHLALKVVHGKVLRVRT